MALRPPRPQSTGWTSGHWADWLIAQEVVHSVRSDEPGTCWLCSAPTRLNALGSNYPSCFACGRGLSPYLRRIVPITYSVSPNGLTSLIAQAKDEPERDWLRIPLASLLHRFLQMHWQCLVAAAGGSIDMIVPIPSHGTTRAGLDHLVHLYSSVRPWPQDWSVGALVKTTLSKADSRRRTVVPGLFAVSPNVDVRRKNILLIDDLCTTGGTIASAADALIGAGANRPLALTIGRQVSAQDLYAQLPPRGWEPTVCAVHPTGPLNPFVTPSRPWA